MTSPTSSVSTDFEQSLSEENLREKITELQVINRMLADFAALVSHDLQSGLRAVGSFAALLRVVPAIATDPQTFTLLNSIEASARKVKCFTDESRVFRNDPVAASKTHYAQDFNGLNQHLAELQSSHQELAEFASSVASKLLNPLSQIVEEAKLLTTQPIITNNFVCTDMASRIYFSAKQMHHLVKAYLCFFHSERQEIRTSPVCLESLIQLVRHELEPLAANRKVTWLVQSLPEVEADAPMLRQVILNLLSNALKYTRKCPETLIEVGGFPGSEELTVYIRDNGIGFDSESARYLFRKFGRLHQDATFEGAGIGLVIVQHIIHRHGGRVWAEAVPGRGATFYFTLPNQGREQ
jgi:light-regulated signal transduction histidine kinase (bacteriophytochrome)